MLTNMLLTGNALSIYELNVSSQWANKDLLTYLVGFQVDTALLGHGSSPEWRAVVSPSALHGVNMGTCVDFLW